ncbi:MAG: hypothetical protein JXR63_06415 [Spirochaetales bacterium]|nr:hypothetical protein [Spirochaetales bacterium]
MPFQYLSTFEKLEWTIGNDSSTIGKVNCSMFKDCEVLDYKLELPSYLKG